MSSRVFIRITLLLTFHLFSHARNSVIFIHIDGAGLAQWQALRFWQVGPDGDTEWDKLPHMAIYRGHIADSLTASSNAGAVAHAYGVRVHTSSFGMDSGGKPISNLQGKAESVMQEAKRRGVRTALINSGCITEPGTALFVATAPEREQHELISEKVIHSGTDIILSGGEGWLIPEGTEGRHGPGRRKDGRNLIEEARKAGYVVVHDREELLAVPRQTKKLLGVFAHEHTFHDLPQSARRVANLSPYKTDAPSLSEMLAKALECLHGEQFLIVAEEEGSDNFANINDATGTLEALRRADQAIGVARKFVKQNNNTLLLTAADSEAGGWDVIGFPDEHTETKIWAKIGRDPNGAPLGLDSDGRPFLSAPDRHGVRHRFVLAWASHTDTSGGLLVRGEGKYAEKIKGQMWNTDVYRVIRSNLFNGLK
ncbi:MAG: alkaline phosphatase [Methylacidiphilales bacterium]|nr:alkaline phosphatase [Candidatus Methylacidiphilales bacterium]MDW8348770.1 alkaline phosphatase [Verrucomicrobiae bacterium]